MLHHTLAENLASLALLMCFWVPVIVVLAPRKCPSCYWGRGRRLGCVQPPAGPGEAWGMGLARPGVVRAHPPPAPSWFPVARVAGAL